MQSGGVDKPRRGASGRIALVGVLLAIAGTAGIAYANEDVGMAIGPSCTIGVTGTAASLTVKGWRAVDACNTFDAGTSILLYRYSGAVTTPAICQYQMQGLRFTVNDEGVLKAIGNILCASLRSKPVPKRQTI